MCHKSLKFKAKRALFKWLSKLLPQGTAPGVYDRGHRCHFKKLIFLVTVYLAMCNVANGQLMNGQRVITAMSYFKFSSSKSKFSAPGFPQTNNVATYYSGSQEITYGVISRKNSMVSGGLLISYSGEKNDNGRIVTSKRMGYSINALVNFQKYYPVTPKLYYAPYYQVAVGYEIRKSSYDTTLGYLATNKGYSFSGSLFPLSLMLNLNQKTNLIFAIGNINIQYQFGRYEFVDTPEFDQRQRDISIDLLLSSISIGIQKVLSFKK